LCEREYSLHPLSIQGKNSKIYLKERYAYHRDFICPLPPPPINSPHEPATPRYQTTQGISHHRDKEMNSTAQFVKEFSAPEKLREFHGQDKNPAPVEYQKEKPIHRRILMLKAHGMSNRQVAAIVEMTPVGVGYVTRQKWFKEALVELMNETGIDGVKQAISGAALDSVFKIIELRDNAASEAVQKDCAFDLVNRYLGKAVQPISSDAKPIADEAKVDAEIAELTNKLKKVAPRITTLTQN
jgi:hypothetical protein